ncbi:MAG TPA: lipid II flippase MurJ, partial [Terricaulis sp.]|nr:lipid II flippase MurJ [Terricaulis sp.]
VEVARRLAAREEPLNRTVLFAAFTAEDAALGAMALFHYGWGVPAFVLAKIYAPGFFAREDTKAPMRFALISMLVNTALGAALFFGLRAAGYPGFPGLAIATSVAAW